MALRTRPFKFTLWKVANAQKRTCRANIQRSVAFEECDSEPAKAPMRYEDLQRKITPKSNECQTDQETKNCDWFSLQKDVASRALAAFIEEQNQLQLKLCLGEERITFSRSKNPMNSDVCPSNIYPENLLQSCGEGPINPACDKLFGPYIETADDIFVGSENKQVHKSKKSVDPHLAAEFFSHREILNHQWESMEGILSEINTKQEGRCHLKETSDVSNQPINSGLGNHPEIVSHLANMVDFCLSGCLSLEEPSAEASEFVNRLSLSKDRILQVPEVERNRPGILYFSDQTKKSPPSKGNGNCGKPTLAQLRNMQDYLAETLPSIFVQRHDYRVYRRDVVFENNFIDPPKTTVGITAYSLQVAKLRMGAHFQYANVRLHLMKATTHEDEGCVRLSWRISGIPQVRAFMFWKFLPWRYKDSKSRESDCREGISTFYLDSNGLITKHQMDRVLPDKGPLVKEEGAKIPGLAV